MRRLALIALLAGCDDLIGVHDFAQVDAGAPVTVHVTRRLVTNDSNFAPTFALQPITPTQVAFADGSPATLTVLADGGVSFPAPPGARYRVAFTESGEPVVAEDDDRDLRLGFVDFGRDDRVVAPAGTNLKFMLGPDYTGGFTQVMSTGLWTTGTDSHDSGDFDFDWLGTASISGPLGLLSADAFDQLFFAHYSLTGNTALIDQVLATSVTMIGGDETLVAGAPSAVPTTSCTSASIPFVADLASLQSVFPGTTVVGAWRLSAMSPEIEHHDSEFLGQGQSTTTDFIADLHYSNVFPGTTAVLEESAIDETQLTGPGGTHYVGLYLQRYDPVGADCPATTTPTRTVAIPGIPILAGSELYGDMDLALDRTQPVKIEWPTAVSGPRDRSRVEIGRTTNGARVRVMAFETDLLEISVDPSLFEADGYYDIFVVNGVGFPGAAAGDFETVAPAIADASVDSAFVHITN